MAEASDDLLLVQLISFQLHAPHRLHDAVVLQALIPGQLRLQRGRLLQAVHVAFLPDTWSTAAFSRPTHTVEQEVNPTHLDVKGRRRVEVGE